MCQYMTDDEGANGAHELARRLGRIDTKYALDYPSFEQGEKQFKNL